MRIAKSAFPQWNKKIIGRPELREYCRKSKVVILEHPTEFLGEYTIFEKRDCIILDPNLKGEKKTWVFAHETGHQLFHHPYEQQFGYKQNLFKEKLDFEADFFGCVAMVPTKLLRAKTLGELIEEYDYPEEMLWIRKEIHERYKRDGL